MIQERVIRFGPDNALTGILTLPSPAHTGGATSTGMLLMSPGALHKIGNCRLNVRLARRVAEVGMPAFRFDFSGLGDSQPRRDVPFDEAVRRDALSAVDTLCAEAGVTRVLSFGLCSGADIGLRLASEDERVVGLAAIDPVCYIDGRARVTRVVRGLARKWHTVPARLLRMLQRRTSGAAAPPTMDEVRMAPPRQVMHAQLSALAARDGRYWALFTSGMFETYAYRGQFASVFRDVHLGDRLEEHYLPAADHLITDPAHQAWMLDTVTAWVVRQGAAPGC